MKEYLDYYDENGKYIGYALRSEIHEKGLWHNTVHCWLYTKDGKVIFQIRKDTNTFYTTASGHVLKDETIKEAFTREIKEEIGLSIDSSDASLVDIVTWKMDKQKSDGTMLLDRAKANVYIDLYEGNFDDFNFDVEEVLGVVIVDAKETLELFEKGSGQINAQIIENQNSINSIIERKVDFTEFLVNKNETAISKYGDILRKIIELTQ